MLTHGRNDQRCHRNRPGPRARPVATFLRASQLGPQGHAGGACRSPPTASSRAVSTVERASRRLCGQAVMVLPARRLADPDPSLPSEAESSRLRIRNGLASSRARRTGARNTHLRPSGRGDYPAPPLDFHDATGYLLETWRRAPASALKAQARGRRRPQARPLLSHDVQITQYRSLARIALWPVGTA